MTPTAEWYEADADDSDRSITDDVTANTHETARAATETGETGATVHGDADLLRKRTAALDRVAAENERLRGEVERMREANDAHRALPDHIEDMLGIDPNDPLEQLAAEVVRLIDSWPKYQTAFGSDYGKAVAQCRDALRAVLARSQAPQAPAEQEGWLHEARAWEDRYAEAIDNLTFAHTVTNADWLDQVTEAVVDVADAEVAAAVREATAGLRAEVERLRAEAEARLAMLDGGAK
jgi:hypothetical protein